MSRSWKEQVIRVVATVKVGEHPQAIAANPLTHMVYVANTHDNTVTVINGANNTVAATVPVGAGPYSLAIDSAANTVYVVGLAGDLTAIDSRTLKATRVAVP